MKTTTGKTINQELSKARRRFEWLRKLQRNVAPTINRIPNFALPRNVGNPPKVDNTLTINYCGELTPAAVVAATARLEKVLGPIVDGKIVAKMGRITMTITVNVPSLELKAA